MNTYQVVERPDQRVVLRLEKPLTEGETQLQSVAAKSWIEARLKVKENRLVQNPGYGWLKR